MKKIFTFIFALILSFNVKAQCPLTEAIDFTATDCYGEETINLFEILDRGQYVLIDFYFYSCSPCQQAVPHVIEAYEAFGCNQHDVFFMEITPFDSDELAQWWAEHYGVPYPTISRDGGGFEIDEDYQVPQYPTLVLIAPDRQILLGDIYPVESAQTIIDALTAFGIEEHSCDEAPEANPSVEITLGEVTTTSIEATFTPNDDCAKYHLLADTQSNMDMWTGMMGVSLEDLVVMWGLEKSSEYTHTWTDFTPNTEYTIYALPKDADGNVGELVTTKVTTEAMGGDGISIIDLEVIVINDSTVRTIATPNEETASYHYGLMEKTYFDSIGEAAAVQYFREDPYVFYEVDDWTWSPLTTNTDFVAIATGQNAAGEWGETTIVYFKTPGGVGCAELMINNLKIYPNPARDFVKVSTDNRQQSTVRVYNYLGMLIDEFEMSSDEMEINVSEYNSGVYFINISNEESNITKKIVVE